MTSVFTPPSIARRCADRLKSLAKSRGIDSQALLRRFALERLLTRLSADEASELWMLKGGTLWWLRDDGSRSIRPTDDMDLHFHDPIPEAEVEEIVRHGMSRESDDGVVYSVGRVQPLRGIDGMRFVLAADIGGSKARIQIDVGFGGRKPPAVRRQQFSPLLKDLPAPHVQVMPWEHVAAEKMNAADTKGLGNTRIRDYFDLWVLSQMGLDVDEIAEAVLHVYTDRSHGLPVALPDGLSDAFAAQELSNNLWATFMANGRLTGPDRIGDTLTTIQPWIADIYRRAHSLAEDRELSQRVGAPAF